jgi:glycosyltransferase involved in cell wall biosynthesis
MKKNKLKIAIIHPTLEILGGAENVILNFAKYFSQSGHSVTIISAGINKEVREYIKELNVEYISIKLPFIPPYDMYLRNIKIMGWYLKLRKILTQFDIINVHNFPATLWVAEAMDYCKTKSCPVIWTCHEPPRALYPEELEDPMQSAIFDKSNLENPIIIPEKTRKKSQHEKIKEKDSKLKDFLDMVIVNSKYTAENFTRIYKFEPVVKYYGIDFNKTKIKEKLNAILEKRKLDSGFRICIISRLEICKNIHNILLAFKEIFSNNQELKDKCIVSIVGSGSLEKDYREYADSLDLSNNVEFLGFLPEEDLENVYEQSHLLLYLPYNEPLGLVPIDAALRGVPAIVSDHGGPTETVVNNKTGYWVNPGSVKDIADKIKYAAQNRVELETMGREAFEYAIEKFWVGDVANYLEKIFLKRYEND